MVLTCGKFLNSVARVPSQTNEIRIWGTEYRRWCLFLSSLCDLTGQSGVRTTGLDDQMNP